MIQCMEQISGVVGDLVGNTWGVNGELVGSQHCLRRLTVSQAHGLGLNNKDLG